MLTFALELAEEAGRLLMARLGTLDTSEIDFKGRVDLVTRVDREAEALIVGAIRSRFPDHVVVAEEGAGETTPAPSGPSTRWIVDPIDGTTNFVHRFPFFAVSIGVEVDGEPALGVIHAPALGETYSATRGGGASLNGAPIRVSTTETLIGSLLATGFAYDRWERPRNNLAEFAALTMRTRGVRRAGAASLDLAYVAAGRLDGYWEFGLAPWDVAAGSLIVAEAGGRVTDIDGGHTHRSGDSILATNGPLHEPLGAVLAEVAAAESD